MKDATRAVIERLANQVADLKRELSEAKERIETVRKKARDDALEEAALVAMARVNPILSGSAFAEIADEIRALKDQPSGEA